MEWLRLGGVLVCLHWRLYNALYSRRTWRIRRSIHDGWLLQRIDPAL